MLSIRWRKVHNAHGTSIMVRYIHNPLSWPRISIERLVVRGNHFVRSLSVESWRPGLQHRCQSATRTVSPKPSTHAATPSELSGSTQDRLLISIPPRRSWANLGWRCKLGKPEVRNAVGRCETGHRVNDQSRYESRITSQRAFHQMCLHHQITIS